MKLVARYRKELGIILDKINYLTKIRPEPHLRSDYVILKIESLYKSADQLAGIIIDREKRLKIKRDLIYLDINGKIKKLSE